MSELRVPCVNTVIVSGRLVRDPVHRMSLQGVSICSFTVANTRYTKAKAGEWNAITAYIPVKCFGGMAERMMTKLKKGRPVMVTGTWNTEQNEGKQDGKRSLQCVWASSVELMEQTGTGADTAERERTEEAAIAAFGDDD